MADRKFRVIRERLLGMLPDELKLSFERLRAKYERVQRSQGIYDRALDRFMDRVEAVYAEAFANEGHQSFTFSESGEVTQVLCACPACQADLQGLPLTMVVEEMIQHGNVDPVSARALRKRASEIESKKYRRKYLLN